MKLSEYLYEKIYAESRKMFDSIEEELLECEPLSANTIEKWIKEYNEMLNKNRIPLKYETE
tara:strand:+ start:185 stop:367 length:183 start_codon:yes stop_codon:yes gene_type:complete